MIGTELFRKIFGTQNDRFLKSIQPMVDRIGALEPEMKKLSNSDFPMKTAQYKERIAKGEPLDSILPEAFALTREAAWRVIGQRHYDVQMIGGITLHRGRIAEMRTGEGKTLVATCPSYLNALTGKGVHVITVNDYLARTHSEWMGRIYGFLGLSTGLIVHGLSDAQRKRNYGCDITYGTNNEFGFDYLRDNMKFRLEDYVQRELHFCIVDEVDSILIDEARTPLIISGPSEDSTDLYYKIDKHIHEDGGLILTEDYAVDEKSRTAALTDAGVSKMEKRLGLSNLYDPINIETLHHVNQGLRAHVLFKRDVDYVVQDGEVIIVDEFTGRLMPGRRWSDGLHQAIEAKEGVNIENENQTLATITFQNYFRMYQKLSGMTGTADTEATEFKQIYKLEVTVIPTNKPMIRSDLADMIYKSEESKFKAILTEIRRIHEKRQPILVGTVSIEKSEKLSHLLKKEGIKHHVLNAKQHEREADLIAQAGRLGAVTIATNMAGRGTDILLGGNSEFFAKNEVGPLSKDANPEERDAHHKALAEAAIRWEDQCKKERDNVRACGGLFILGTERHESRRIDNQLRGRAGRQGDPGESRFYLSLDDDLMRIFGGARIKKFMEDDVPIEHRWITKAIADAQKKVEAHNYDIRKHLLQYDDVMNQQRKVIYGWRREVLSNESLKEMVDSLVVEISENIADEFFPGGKLRKKEGLAHLDTNELREALKITFQIDSQIEEKDIGSITQDGVKNYILQRARARYEERERELGTDVLRQLERVMLLTTIDQLWKDHLLAMDHLRDGVGLQGYGQKDPLVEYKKEGFRFFSMMMGQISTDVVRKLYSVQMTQGEESRFERAPERNTQLNLNRQDDAHEANDSIADAVMSGVSKRLAMENFVHKPRQMTMNTASEVPGASAVNREMRAGRNDPCPCGSGKKFKKCHGA